MYILYVYVCIYISICHHHHHHPHPHPRHHYIYIYYIYHHDYDHSMCQQCVREMALCLAHHEYFPCHLSVVCAQCAGVNHLKIEYYIINIP